MNADQQAAIERLEQELLGLLKGEYSSLSLTFNEQNGPQYQTVAEALADGEADGLDWVSEQEKSQAALTNRWWTLHWYPDTPVGFYAISAASLPTLLNHVLEERNSG